MVHKQEKRSLNVKTMKLSNNGVQVNEDGIVLSSEEYENYIYIK